VFCAVWPRCAKTASGRYLLYAQSGAALSNPRHLLARNSGQSQRMIPAMVILGSLFFKLSTDPDFEVAVQGGQQSSRLPIFASKCEPRTRTRSFSAPFLYCQEFCLKPPPALRQVSTAVMLARALANGTISLKRLNREIDRSARNHWS
jgi:hypothetical protein